MENNGQAGDLAGADGRAAKKVQLRQEDPPPDTGEMMVDGTGVETEAVKSSFKDKLMNNGMGAPVESMESDEVDGFEIGEDDVERVHDDVEPKTVFKDRIMRLVADSMKMTVIIGFSNIEDYQLALSEGPWIVYGHTLSIQPWSPEFSPLKPHPTSSATRGRFARLAVTVNLSKNLKSLVWVNGVAYGIEYESLPLICFGCGKYGHLKGDCPSSREQDMTSASTKEPESVNEAQVTPEPREKFGAWMVVKRPPRKSNRPKQITGDVDREKICSRYEIKKK
ncbi:uncharacterized protein LOC121751841 [Salvia splendens]|uniref:uncharacterized protein LOC121751841 n=1 Tax=Salvia splendens TaxID=180675 RepID=UPI001C27E007|nr:uncharacterized protein LOC121751841 [Salvia splendens]